MTRLGKKKRNTKPTPCNSDRDLLTKTHLMKNSRAKKVILFLREKKARMMDTILKKTFLSKTVKDLNQR